MDGTPILVWGPTGTGDWSAYWPRSCWWSEHGHGKWVLCEDDNGATFIDDKNLTHWMPLPQPPGNDSDGTECLQCSDAFTSEVAMTAPKPWQKVLRLLGIF